MLSFTYFKREVDWVSLSQLSHLLSLGWQAIIIVVVYLRHIIEIKLFFGDLGSNSSLKLKLLSVEPNDKLHGVVSVAEKPFFNLMPIENVNSLLLNSRIVWRLSHHC